MEMTVIELEVLLHHYYCQDQYPQAPSPALKKAFDRHVMNKLLSVSEGVYSITEKGQYYVAEGVCKVPLPVLTWTIPKQL
jgi:hypothetical protein